MAKIHISAIAAMSENRVIGVDNGLPWHIPADFKFFKATTLGRPVIMGRKSYESLGQNLPGRANIVITRSGNGPVKINDTEGPFVFESVKDAIEEARKVAMRDRVDEIFIIGGGEIFRQTLPITDRMYLTLVHKRYDGDVTFPEFDRNDWAVTREERHEGDPAFTFLTFERKRG
ncbi:MAG: dihydrofolate reductase [Alphaproteobacteria bacterium]